MRTLTFGLSFLFLVSSVGLAASPSFIYVAPAATSAPIYCTTFASASIPQHGTPTLFNVGTAAAGQQVSSYGQQLGVADASGNFSITFPAAGIYWVTVGGCPGIQVIVA